ncbi:MAG: helix-turn-helix domain-containing protein [Burkholderiaceae bacterium]
MTKTKAIDKPGTAQQSQLARAFDVINALINATQPMKLKALAEVTRLDASGTLRLLKTLVELGYVIRIESTKSYLPSVKALFPIGLYHPIQELRRDAAQLLIEIQQTCDVTSALQIFLG